MITGFNTDIEHDGVVYHVQTEDKGLGSPLILSLVYSGGAILASKRSPYQDLIAAGFDEEVLSARLKKQHRLICAAITTGRIEELKRMGAKAAHEEKAVICDNNPVVVPERFEIESSSERAPVVDEPEEELIAETSEEPLASVEEPPDTSTAPEEDVVSKPQARPRAKESAYTVYDSRRKAPVSQPVESESGLVLSILDDDEFYAGKPFTIRILLQNRQDKKEKPVAGATVSLKILGTGFRPQIFSVKTARDGVGIVSGKLPHFSSGRAAIVIRVVLDDRSAEVRRIIHPAV